MKLFNNVAAAAVAVLFAGSVTAADPIVTVGGPATEQHAMSLSTAETAIVRKALHEGQELERMDTFYELFDPDFVDHTPLPGSSPTREGVRRLSGQALQFVVAEASRK